MRRHVSIEELDQLERPSPESTLALEGNFNGRLLHKWESNLRRRRGQRAVKAARDALGPLSSRVPAAPANSLWLPVGIQLRLTEILADQHHDANLVALWPGVREDAFDRLPLPVKLFVRALGASRSLRRLEDMHDHFYDIGEAVTDAHADGARVVIRGAAVFGHPTWRVLEMFFMRIVVELATGREIRHWLGEDLGADAFAIELGW